MEHYIAIEKSRTDLLFSEMERWPQFIDERENINHREAGIRTNPVFVFKNVSYIWAWKGFASHSLILRNGIRKGEWGKCETIKLYLFAYFTVVFNIYSTNTVSSTWLLALVTG